MLITGIRKEFGVVEQPLVIIRALVVTKNLAPWLTSRFFLVFLNVLNLLPGVRKRLPDENTAVEDEPLQRCSLDDKAAVEFIKGELVPSLHRKVEDSRFFHECLSRLLRTDGEGRAHSMMSREW